VSRVIRASAVGEYVFCHRAWWYRYVQGEAPRNLGALQAGTRAHVRHGRLVTAALLLRALAVLLALAAIVALVLALLPSR
jgi:CRISPR/Cas system-associated exonuclease Cas4 (RecB family)